MSQEPAIKPVPSSGAGMLVFSYNSACPMFLGFGVDVANPFEAKMSPFELPKDEASNSLRAEWEHNGVEKQSFIAELLSDSEYFHRHVTGGASIWGNGLMNGSFNFTSSLDFSTDKTMLYNSLNLVISQRTSFGKKFLRPNLKLNDEAKKLGDENIPEFRKRYGTHYVMADSRGAACTAVITVANLSKTSLNYLKAILDLSFIGQKSSAGGSGSYETFVYQASQHGVVSLRFFASGGNPLKTPKKVSVENLEEILDTIREHSESLKSDTVPVEFSILAPYSNFGVHDPTVGTSIENWRNMGRLYLRKLKLMSELERGLNIISILKTTGSSTVGQVEQVVQQCREKIAMLEREPLGPGTLDPDSVRMVDPFTEPFKSIPTIVARPLYDKGYLKEIEIILRADIAYGDILQRIIAERLSLTNLQSAPIQVGYPIFPERKANQGRDVIVDQIIEKIEIGSVSDYLKNLKQKNERENDGTLLFVDKLVKAKKSRSETIEVDGRTVKTDEEIAKILESFCMGWSYQLKIRTAAGDSRYFVGSPDVRDLRVSDPKN